MALTPGTRLGPYDILTLLGSGGMGEVYRAHDSKLNRDVAIKVLLPAVANDPDRLARFSREAQVLASLNHPNIAHIHGLEDAGGIRALVLELVEGPTLADRIAHGAIPIAEALPIAQQIAEALEAAHEQGIIHRDLKPANIKVRADGTVKVLDFGLAKALDPAGMSGTNATMSPTLTAASMPGMILGTAAYMSPEQARGKVVDKRADIWAFGVVLYETLTGRRLFDGATVSDTLAHVLMTDPDWTAFPANTPAPIRRLLRRCLEKDRKRRLADIADARMEIEDARSEPEPAFRPAPEPALHPAHRVLWIVAPLTLVAFFSALVPAVLYFRRAMPDPIVTRLDVVTPSTTNAFSFALSPDGRQLAFVANGEHGSQLWLRPLDQVAAQPLAGTEGASFPFWAPDNRAIGFFADSKLKRLDVAGGAPQVLADAIVPRGGTWNRDGIIVFAPSSSGGLMRVGATGGTPVPVTQLAAGQSNHRWPQFLPDGRRFLFFAATSQVQAARGVYVASLAGGEPTRVAAAAGMAAVYAPPGYLLRANQGTLFAQRFDVAHATVSGEPTPVAQAVGTDDGTFHSAFSVSAVGVLAHRAGAATRRQLVWVDRTGNVLGAIGSPDDSGLAAPELAPDGRRVAVYRTVQANLDVWLMDVSRGVPSRFTFDEAVDSSPVWSPDGSRIVFRSNRNGVYGLFVKPASAAADEQPLLANSHDKMPLDWSADGRFLLYAAQDPKTGSDLWALPLTGDRKPVPLVQTSFDEIEGQFSPDGRWLAYASNEAGRYEIYVQSFPESGGKSRISTAGGVQPRWGREGRELFYVAPDNRLMAVSIHVASDARTVEAGAPLALFPTRLASGGNANAAGYGARAQYAVARDGRLLMNIAVDDAVASPITIVQHWDAALKK